MKLLLFAATMDPARSPTPLESPPEPQSSTTFRRAFKQGSGSLQPPPPSCWTISTPKRRSNSLSSGAPGAHLICPFVSTVSAIRCQLHSWRVSNAPQDTIGRIMPKKLHHSGKQCRTELVRAAFHPGNTFSSGVYLHAPKTKFLSQLWRQKPPKHFWLPCCGKFQLYFTWSSPL